MPLLVLQSLQPALHGFCSLKRFAQLIQGILLLLLVGIVGGRGSLADLFLDVVEAFFDRALVLCGISEIAILRRGVIENLPPLLNPILELLPFDGVCRRTRLIRGVSIFLAVAEGFQLVGHGLQL